MHLPERLGDAVGRAQDGQKESQGAVRAAKRVVDKIQVAANRLVRLSAQLIPHLLPIPKDLQQPDRVDPKKHSRWAGRMWICRLSSTKSSPISRARNFFIMASTGEPDRSAHRSVTRREI